MTQGDDELFWNAAERIEQDFIGDGDEVRFRKRMKQIGFDDATVNERIESVRGQKP